MRVHCQVEGLLRPRYVWLSLRILALVGRARDAPGGTIRLLLGGQGPFRLSFACPK